jgi:membrane-associated protease RseP (regulator of RpoE activity)
MRGGRITRLHVILFVLTLLSTLVVGAVHAGVKAEELLSEPSKILEGVPFSFTLMLILLTHELSHFFASRYHRTQATLPYFIPAPTIFGTFGAFIKMTSPILSRRALVDIGASGPIAGFVVAIVACAFGLSNSEFVPIPAEEEGVYAFGSSILFAVLAKVFMGTPPDGFVLDIHPVAFAGWIGLFVTFLNLFPIGQLDGGHVAFALLGRRHVLVSMGLVMMLAIAGALLWEGWLIWAILMVVLGLRHPPVMNWEVPLDPRRKLVGIIALIIFALTFIPVPIAVFSP